MRNPERTTKAERRAAKRWNRLAARTFGVAEAARYMRAGVLLDEAAGLDRLAYAMLVDRYSDVMSRLVEPRPRPSDDLAAWAKATAERAGNAVLAEHGLDDRYTVVYDTTGAAPVGDLDAPTHTGYEIGTGPNPHITLKYPPHVSFVASVPYRNGKHHVDGLAEAWRKFQEGRDMAEYATDWDGGPWHDPNEAAALSAEAIEDALADDVTDEDDHHV